MTVLITDDWKVYCGNAGDSRAIMSSHGKAIPLSFDHKPTNAGAVLLCSGPRNYSYVFFPFLSFLSTWFYILIPLILFFSCIDVSRGV